MFRLLHVAPTGGITIQDLTITGGRAASGGGIWNEGTLVLAGSRLEENTADGGWPKPRQNFRYLYGLLS
jgi:hypothetical protein